VFGIAARRPHQDHHAAAQVSNSDNAKLSVVVPVVRPFEDRAGEHLFRMFEIEPAFAQRPFALGRTVVIAIDN